MAANRSVELTSRYCRGTAYQRSYGKPKSYAGKGGVMDPVRRHSPKPAVATYGSGVIEAALGLVDSARYPYCRCNRYFITTAAAKRNLRGSSNPMLISLPPTNMVGICR